MDTLTLAIIVLIVVNVAGLAFTKLRKTNAVTEDGMTVDAAQEAMMRAKRERFEFIGGLFKSKNKESLIERNLVTAGLVLKPSEFMMLNLVFLALVMLIGLLHIASMAPAFGFLPFVKRVLWMAFYIYIGWRIPQLVLQYLADKRRTKLEYQLADALTIIASGLKGGYSFVQGLDMASQQLEVPIKDETARVLRLIQLGLDTPRALLQLAERVNSYDYDMTVSATNIQLSVGGNLSLLLENIAATIRDRIRLRRDIAVLTAQGRMSGMILIALPIGIAIMLRVVNPEYMSKLFETDMGNNLLYLAIGMQAIGIYWIKKLLDFDN
jgi:tight adherence protein B